MSVINLDSFYSQLFLRLCFNALFSCWLLLSLLSSGSLLFFLSIDSLKPSFLFWAFSLSTNHLTCLVRLSLSPIILLSFSLLLFAIPLIFLLTSYLYNFHLLPATSSFVWLFTANSLFLVIFVTIYHSVFSFSLFDHDVSGQFSLTLSFFLSLILIIRWPIMQKVRFFKLLLSFWFLPFLHSTSFSIDILFLSFLLLFLCFSLLFFLYFLSLLLVYFLLLWWFSSHSFSLNSRLPSFSLSFTSFFYYLLPFRGSFSNSDFVTT